LGLVIVFRISSAARTDYGPVPQQEVIRLDQRISQLEQRLYSIEASLRTLEQYSRAASTTSRTAGQEDVSFLRAEVQALRQRLAEDECGLAKLDERTLAPTMRDARRKSATASDPCRVNFDTPLRLPERRQ
jgi:predicted  nucleic acid-binding Zn-ribbon protein